MLPMTARVAWITPSTLTWCMRATCSLSYVSSVPCHSRRRCSPRWSPCALVRLIYQPHDPRAVVHADRRRRASSPMVERIAQCGESRRGDVGAWERIVTLGGGEFHDPVLHCENGVAACDLPLTVSAVTGKAIADLDGTEDAARRAQHYRSVVLDWALMRAPAQLGASHLRLLAGQVKEHVYPVWPQVAEAAAAGLGGIEHPSAIPGLVARRSRPVEPNVDVRQRAKAPHSEQLAGARGEGRVALGQRDGDKRIEPGCFGSYRLHLSRVDPHRLLHQKRIALIQQVVRDPGHLPVPPQAGPERSPFAELPPSPSGLAYESSR